MAFENLGQSFLPQGTSGESAGPGGNRLEDILSVHSFRIPRVLGARPIAPAQLLNAEGGNPMALAVLSLLQKVMAGAPMGGQDPGAGDPLARMMAPFGGGFSSGGGAPQGPMPGTATPPVQIPANPGGPLGGGGGIPPVGPPRIVPGEEGGAGGNFMNQFQQLTSGLRGRGV